eukprot:TRINITY_DN2181_c0_g1_i1.p1 TRINITY_DN2181_c0_g1~~TRINITY_DN2181_c0_g1_i1.p1  ORF type:complete len:161 (+),score=21.50 TRINITY_DN2181_c0_g1_i1:25-507(+)
MRRQKKEAQKMRGVHFTCFELLLREVVDLFSEKVGDSATENINHFGHSIGRRLVERSSRNKDRLKEDVSLVKFICKEFWQQLHGVQIDNLKTNHHGVFVFTTTDNWFKAYLSEKEAKKYIAFSCGLIRGALSGLGKSDSNVNADISALSLKGTIRFEIEL